MIDNEATARTGSAVQLLHGDCVELMRKMSADSVDAVVTDPPYGLEFMGKDWDRLGGGRTSKPGIGERAVEWPNSRGWNERRCANCGHLSHGGSPCRCPNPRFVLADNRWVRMQEWHARWVAAVLRVLKPGGHLLAFGGSRTQHRLTCAIEDAGFEIRDCIMWVYATGFPKSLNVGGGCGTALKPAYEPIVLTRKPLVGTVVKNVQRYGTGVLNIDACRIAFARERLGAATGRWPANVILDETAAAILDAQAGIKKSGNFLARHKRSVPRLGTNTYGVNLGHPESSTAGRDFYGDEGGPSRFFYCAKASRAEREFGCEDLPRKSAGAATDRKDGSDGLKSPRAGAGRTTKAGIANTHPCVKPLALMRYLVRLVTPPNGVVLDPFAGSGTTGIAAVLEGFRFVGCEITEDYVPIATARIRAAVKQSGSGKFATRTEV